LRIDKRTLDSPRVSSLNAIKCQRMVAPLNASTGLTSKSPWT
jgi:hypothetical protein